MDDTNINECFRLLKLRRGADLAAVKRAYRKNLYRCHPDRFQNRPEVLAVAERKTKRLIQVYGILEEWYAKHGGIDPVSSFWQAGRGASPAEPASGVQEKRNRTQAGLRGWKIAAAGAIALCLAFAAWKYLSRPEGPFIPEVSKEAAKASPSPIKAAVARTAASPPDGLGLLRAAVGARAAELGAVSGAREAARTDWLRTYMKRGAAELGAAKDEWEAAQVQYRRDVLDAAPDIEHAEAETARRVEQARLESASARDAFAKEGEDQLKVLKNAYDQWLLLQGNEAVGLLRQIRKREDSKIGVFSDTEDPQRIFEFWTAEEAGGPEISIAAKTGVTVLQPDDRFFPHFRSNINLYPEGKRLVQMMETIIARHRELHQELEDRKRATQAELEHWGSLHPIRALGATGALGEVLNRRDLATGRLEKARVSLERATRAVSPEGADEAFELSAKGREWAARATKARADLVESQRALAAADSASAPR
jgi:curved DNA-binding protein CbpA